MGDSRTLMAAGGLAAPFERMPHGEVIGLLRERYGVNATIEQFDTEKDDTFLVSCEDGSRIVLKIANPVEDEREISLQLELLLHVEKADPGLAVPRVVKALDGSPYFALRDSCGQSRIVRALSFLDGMPLDRIQSTATERERLGEILGRLRLAMAGFSHPHDGREIAWDVKNLSKLRGLLSTIENRDHRQSLEQGIDRYEGLSTALAGCRTQVVHNDCSKSNIVIDRARPEFISGIIDFGDVVRTAIAIDVSTTLLNQLPQVSRPDIFREGKDVLAGYLRAADLTEAELAIIPHLVMARVVARALITTWRAAQFPDNEIYIMRNTHQGWSQLEWFLSRSVDEVSDALAGMREFAGKPKIREQA